MKFRKRIVSISLITLLILSLCSLASFASDTTPNPEEPVNCFRAAGFENGMDEWWGGDGVTITQEEAHTGSSSIKILQNKKFFSNILIQENIALAAGKYEFSFYYKGENIDELASITCAFGYEDDQSEGIGDVVALDTNATGWKKITQGIELNQARNILFLLTVTDCSVPIYLDDLCLMPADTILINGGFEDGLDNWTVVNPDNMMFSDTTLQARSGSSSLLIGGLQDELINNGLTQTCLISGPGNYELSAYVKAAYPFTGDGVMLIISHEDSQETFFDNYMLSGNNLCDDWTQISCSLYVPAGTMRVNVGITSYNSNCVFLIDDVEFKQSTDMPIGNILANSGFESNLKNWTVQGEGNITVSVSEKFEGMCAAQFSSSVNEGLNKYIEQSYTVITGGTIEFSGYIKTVDSLSGVGAVLFIKAFDENDNILAASNSSAIIDTNNTWKKVSVSLTLPTGTEKVIVRIGGLYFQGSFYVDGTKLHYILP